MNTRPGDIEVNRIRDADRGVCIQNCLSERARTAVVGVGHGVSCQNEIGISLKTSRKGDVGGDGADLILQIESALRLMPPVGSSLAATSQSVSTLISCSNS